MHRKIYALMGLLFVFLFSPSTLSFPLFCHSSLQALSHVYKHIKKNPFKYALATFTTYYSCKWLYTHIFIKKKEPFNNTYLEKSPQRFWEDWHANPKNIQEKLKNITPFLFYFVPLSFLHNFSDESWKSLTPFQWLYLYLKFFKRRYWNDVQNSSLFLSEEGKKLFTDEHALAALQSIASSKDDEFGFEYLPPRAISNEIPQKTRFLHKDLLKNMPLDALRILSNIKNKSEYFITLLKNIIQEKENLKDVSTPVFKSDETNGKKTYRAFTQQEQEMAYIQTFFQNGKMYIEQVTTHDQYQQAGIGSALLQYLIEDCKTIGIEEIKLNWNKLLPSYELYRKHNFILIDYHFGTMILSLKPKPHFDHLWANPPELESIEPAYFYHVPFGKISTWSDKEWDSLSPFQKGFLCLRYLPQINTERLDQIQSSRGRAFFSDKEQQAHVFAHWGRFASNYSFMHTCSNDPTKPLIYNLEKILSAFPPDLLESIQKVIIEKKLEFPLPDSIFAKVQEKGSPIQ